MINLENFPEFKDCTPKEQQFLRVYLDPESADYLNIETATKAAFDVAQSNALAYGRQILSRPRIKSLCEKANAASTPLPTLDEFKRKLWTTIAASNDPKATLGALTLYADISGWRNKTSAKKSAEDEDDPFDALNDIKFEEPSGKTHSSNKEEDSK